MKKQEKNEHKGWAVTLSVLIVLGIILAMFLMFLFQRQNASADKMKQLGSQLEAVEEKFGQLETMEIVEDTVIEESETQLPVETIETEEETETEQNSKVAETTEESEETKVSSAENADAMRADLQTILNEKTYSGERWAISIQSVDGSDGVSINSKQMKAASLIKLYIMGAVYEDYNNITQVNGKNTVDSLLYSMITVSDNDASNTLTRMLGKGDAVAGRQVVNAFCTSHGYNDSNMGRMLLEQNPSGENYTSVADCTKFLKDVYNGNLTSSSSMLSLLKQQQRTGKIPAGVPSGIITANKTGELADVENDAAIVYADGGTYILSVMSENLASTAAARSTIVSISGKVYEYYQ